MRSRARGHARVGIALAFVTAVVSGVSIYVNAHGVTHFDDATVYTTAKNAGRRRAPRSLLALACRAARAPSGSARARAGGSGSALARASRVDRRQRPVRPLLRGPRAREATQAAFIHKTLVVWVALLAVPLLRERFGAGARARDRARSSAGQAWLAGDAGTVAFGSGRGDDPRRDAALGGRGRSSSSASLPGSSRATLAAARMALGAALLVGWVAVSGARGDLLAASASSSGAGRS